MRRLEKRQELAALAEQFEQRLKADQEYAAWRAQRPSFEPKLYASPVSLPERKVGKLRIVHSYLEAGKVTPIVSMREAICTGKAPVSAKITKRTRVHELREEGHGLWMTDLPCELNQMAEAVYEALPHGSVCIGGLGLGILAGMVRDMKKQLGVREIVVVERSRGVIELCAGKGYIISRGDIYQYLRASKQHDTYLLDTWQGQGELCYWNEVLPARRIIRNRFGAGPRIWCWKEDEMWGQVYRSLRASHRHWYYTGLPPSMSHDEAIFFLEQVGTQEWEQRYGAAVNAAVKDNKGDDE